jgi:hypothetical protein
LAERKIKYSFRLTWIYIVFLKEIPLPPLVIKLLVPRDKWNNLTSKAKCTFTEYRKEANKPGGGPASGIKGGLETAGFTNEQNAIINSSNTLWRCQFIPFKTQSRKQTTNK